MSIYAKQRQEIKSLQSQVDELKESNEKNELFLNHLFENNVEELNAEREAFEAKLTAKKED